MLEIGRMMMMIMIMIVWCFPAKDELGTCGSIVSMSYWFSKVQPACSLTTAHTHQCRCLWPSRHRQTWQYHDCWLQTSHQGRHWQPLAARHKTETVWLRKMHIWQSGVILLHSSQCCTAGMAGGRKLQCRYCAVQKYVPLRILSRCIWHWILSWRNQRQNLS